MPPSDRRIWVRQSPSTCKPTASLSKKRMRVSRSLKTNFLSITADTDLEVIHAVTDTTTGLGAIKALYVYAGDQPIMRFTVTSAGVLNAPDYYLEDANGSVTALVNPAGVVTRFRYDGFGVARVPGTGGYADPAAVSTYPPGTGGDFRFHGHWLEADSGFYHMRARDYDPTTGRFLSRDPVEGAVTEPESYHPYAFAYGNPHVYSDPTGEFTVMEINFTMNGQFSQKTFQGATSAKFQSYLKDKVHEAVHEQLAQAIGRLLPIDFTRVFEQFGPSIAGAEFGDAVVRFGLCGIPSLKEMVHRDPYVSTAGEPESDGFVCGDNRMQGNKFPHPDFILSSEAPGLGGKSYLVGEAKWQSTTLQWYFRNPQRYRQWQAITGYAKKKTYSKVALFITFARGDKERFKQIKERMKRDNLSKGVNIIVIPLTNLKF